MEMTFQKLFESRALLRSSSLYDTMHAHGRLDLLVATVMSEQSRFSLSAPLYQQER